MTQRPQNALGVGVRTQRPTHLPFSKLVELKYKAFQTLVEEFRHFLPSQIHIYRRTGWSPMGTNPVQIARFQCGN